MGIDAGYPMGVRIIMPMEAFLMRLSEALVEFEADVRLSGSPRTAEVYAYAVRRLIRELGDVEVREASDADLRRFLAGMRVAPATRRLYLIALRGFFEFCVRMGWREDNPARRLRLPARPWRRQAVVRAEDVRRLLAACDDSPRGRRNAAVVAMLFETGLRASEACALRVEDVDLQRRIVRVMGKGNRERTAPFGEETARRLRAWLEVRPAGLRTLFGLNRYGLKTMLRRLCAAADLPLFSPHAFRRGWATSLVEMGVPLKAVKEWGGWSDYRILEVYIRYVETEAMVRLYRSPLS